MGMTTTNAFEVLKAATMDIRNEYRTRYVELEIASLNRIREGLAAVGMDAHIFAPYPHSQMSRMDYQTAVSKHNLVRSLFEQVGSSRGMHDPEIVRERKGAESRLIENAKRDADLLVDSYLSKMVVKIGKEITAAQTNGRIWDSATLTVTCTDGEIQTWNTRCILNRSVLGKLFNQWPTRRQK